MISLPLYKDFEPPLAAVDLEEPRSRDPGCSLCELPGVAKPRTVCVPPEGDVGGLLIVGESPGRNEDLVGRPFVGESGRLLRPLVQKYWKGPLAIDNAVRCFPGRGGIKDEYVEACRGYVSKTIRDVKPTRVLALGAWSIYSLLGRTASVLSVRKGYGWLTCVHDQVERKAGTTYVHDGPPVPVFYVLHPAAALRNRFVRGWFEEDLKWALTTPDPPRPPWDGVVRVVSTRADAELAEADLRTADWVTFDVETAGRMWDAMFTLLSVSFAVPGSNSAWVWDYRAVGDAGTGDVLRRILADSSILKVGQNVKYDTNTIKATLGIEVQGIHGDTRLWRKILDPEAAADLDTMSELVGMGGHKSEAKKARVEGVKKVRKAFAELKGTAKKPPRLDAVEEVLKSAELPPEIESLIRLGTDPTEYEFGLMPRDVLLRYNGLDTIATARLGEMLERELRSSPLSRVWDTIVKGAERAIAQVEEWGFLCDESVVRQFDRYLGNHLGEIKAKFVAAGYPDLNVNSTPQVADLLYNVLGLIPPKLTDSGKPSTDAEALELLSKVHPIAGHIKDWREYQKLKGTYAEGMLSHIRSDGRVHSSLHLDGARSGRLSSSDPNMQNIPSPTSSMGKMSRDCFVAPRGRVLVQADYSQLELRVAAMLSGDPMMTQIFVDGLDYHQRTAEMVSLQAWGVHPSAVTSAHRKAAKIINFRTLYGGGDAANAKEIGCTTAEAARVREAIFGKFTKLASFIQACRNRALKTGFAWTWWNGEDFRRRSLYRVADPDDEMRTVHEHASWNTPIQGTASDFCLASLVEIVNWIKDDCVPARVVMTVHDSIVLEVDEGAVREVYEQVRRIMQSWPANGVPLVADMEIGRSWGSMEELSFCQHCDQRELVDHAPGIVDRFCCPARESVFRLTGS